VLFGEQWTTEPGPAAQLAAGLVLVAIGVWLLTRQTAGALARAQGAEPAL
jgi:hypothetical protein